MRLRLKHHVDFTDLQLHTLPLHRFSVAAPGVFTVSPVGRRSLPTTRKEHSHTIHIVRKISQSNFGQSSFDADGSQNQIPRLLRLHSENMLNPRTNPGSGSIAALLAFGQFALAAALALNMFSKTLFLQTLLGLAY
jgi:hypothetical protein